MPLHHLQAAQGAVFGASGGWDVANYFTTDADAVTELSFGKPGWLASAIREHESLRAGTAIVDVSHAAKLMVQGPDTRTVLDRISTVAPPSASDAVDALWLNDDGGVEPRVAIWRPDAADAYLVISDTGTPLADADWISRHTREDETVTVADVTAGWAVMWLIGPAATKVLARQAGSDHLPGPDGSATVDLGLCRVHTRQAQLAGEAGWCLLTTVDYAAHVYDTLTGSQVDEPAVPIGEYTLSLVAVDNTWPAWGTDVGPKTTPAEVGLTHMIDTVASHRLRGAGGTADRGRCPAPSRAAGPRRRRRDDVRRRAGVPRRPHRRLDRLGSVPPVAPSLRRPVRDRRGRPVRPGRTVGAGGRPRWPEVARGAGLRA